MLHSRIKVGNMGRERVGKEYHELGSERLRIRISSARSSGERRGMRGSHRQSDCPDDAVPPPTLASHTATHSLTQKVWAFVVWTLKQRALHDLSCLEQSACFHVRFTPCCVHHILLLLFLCSPKAVRRIASLYSKMMRGNGGNNDETREHVFPG